MQDIATLKHPRGTTLLILHLLALHLTVLSLFCHGLDFVILIGEKIRLIKAPSTPSIPILRVFVTGFFFMGHTCRTDTRAASYVNRKFKRQSVQELE
ncbi:hypothetical protein AAZX31_09G102200 [Glycine max]|uniref:Uncharacterized protein n=3 Tax=Glycine subgen. Soja TaxID=1462606 RepID=K7LD61_SOYBN|nr:hypothetical protein JHK87_024676 [Glycine soja]KAG5006778.1 hypothetical protein JHK85_025320 [Glycine max]KAG5012573.1 hypothetical protein JHK86_024834 [Glycine max]KAG5133530.1 hypothetical protein JHK82_024718 [Glycine max]KAH1042500.1 hypothetical protein GYH30_024687 [Glycine max]